MKKLLLLISIIILPSILQAQNYFIDRTYWIIAYNKCYPEIGEGYSIGYSFLYYESFGWPDSEEEGLVLNENLNKNLEYFTPMCLIETDGDKVYFKKRNSSEWLLFYDFGLQAGEKTTIYSLYQTDADDNPVSAEVECLEVIENDPDYNGLTTMRMRQVVSDSQKAEITDNEVSEDIFIWIKGMGSTQGVGRNYSASIPRVMYFTGSTLLGVWSEGDFIYKNENYNGIETVEPDTSKQSADPLAPVYDLTGRMVGKQADLITLPSGIYISNGKKILK